VDFLRERLDFLRQTQNADGGWGYFPGKQSWLEPTAWAALALHGDARAARAWTLIRSWQNEDGSCRPCASVPIPNWTAALAVTLGVLHRDETVVKRGVAYLLDTTGADSFFLSRVAKAISPDHTDREPKFKGWPWKPGNSSWIEPTAHSVTALRLAGGGSEAVKERIASAQRMILHMRCMDGGWNYGARIALGHPLASFPETTALALVGLAGRPDAVDAVKHATGLLAAKQSPLSSAWLRIALRLHGREVSSLDCVLGEDILLAALESIGSPDGNWRLLKA
jgi:hypothetical protein